MMRVLGLLALLLMTGCLSVATSSSVKITNMKENSGGSGSVISSTQDGSLVLTNAHVCRVVEHGGLLHTDAQTVSVYSYKISKLHDLCLIKTLAQLGIASKVSEDGPDAYEDAKVVGHPVLLPTIVSKGHFSGTQTIQILTGVQACTAEQMQSPETGLLCLFLGGLPIITTYEAQAVSATIQPGSSGSPVYGSSGSPVYGSDGRIKGVVFAGRGEFGYGFIVPYIYVREFLKKESATLEEQFPKYTTIIGSETSRPSLSDLSKKLSVVCKKLKTNKICQSWESYQLIEMIKE